MKIVLSMILRAEVVQAGLKCTLLFLLLTGCAATGPTESPGDPAADQWRAWVFLSDECSFSAELRDSILPDPRVKAAFAGVELRIVLDDEASGGWELQRRFATTVFPRVVLENRDAPQDAIVGALPVESFLSEWERIRTRGLGTVAQHEALVREFPAEPVALHELGVKQLMLGQIEAALATWQAIRVLPHAETARVADSLLNQIRNTQLFIIELDVEHRASSVGIDHQAGFAAFIRQADVPTEFRLRAARRILHLVRSDKFVESVSKARTDRNDGIRVGLAARTQVSDSEWLTFAAVAADSLWKQLGPLDESERTLALELSRLLASFELESGTAIRRARAQVLWLSGDLEGAREAARLDGVRGDTLEQMLDGRSPTR